MFQLEIQDGRHGCHLENLFFVSSPKTVFCYHKLKQCCFPSEKGYILNGKNSLPANRKSQKLYHLYKWQKIWSNI